MSAIEEADAAGTAGKDTPAGIQPSGAASPHAVTAVWPHLAYGDAVHAEFAAWELRPERLDAGIATVTAGDGRVRRELFLRLVWPVGHEDLAPDVRGQGLTVAWAPMTGWSAHTAEGELLLAVDELAAPAVVADAALHLVEDGLDCGWAPAGVVARWELADALHNALSQFDEREAGR